MKQKKPFKNIAIFIIFILCLFVQNHLFAMDSANTESPAIQTNNQTQNSIEINVDKNNTINNSNTDKPTPLATFSIPKTNNNEIKKSPAKEPEKKLTPVKNSKYTINVRGRTIDLKKHLHLTTLIALFGLTGTVFGLFSTWLIYHLNKKHNNPMLIDKHNSAIKYMDELNRIKLYFAHSDIKRLYSIVNNSTENRQEELQKMVLSYEDICKNISKIDILTINTRYEKHMNKRKREIFESLIANYKMIKIDGDYLNNSGEYCHIFDLETSIDLNKLNTLRSKIVLISTFEKQMDIILGVLRKELKL